MLSFLFRATAQASLDAGWLGWPRARGRRIIRDESFVSHFFSYLKSRYEKSEVWNLKYHSRYEKSEVWKNTIQGMKNPRYEIWNTKINLQWVFTNFWRISVIFYVFLPFFNWFQWFSANFCLFSDISPRKSIKIPSSYKIGNTIQGMKNLRYEIWNTIQGMKNPRYEIWNTIRGMKNPRYEKNCHPPTTITNLM